MVTFFRPRKDGEDDNAIDSVILGERFLPRELC